MLKKIIFGIIIFIVLFNYIGVSYAIEITKADLIKIGTADYHLKYFREDRGYASYIICSIVGYNNNGKFYPAYCMNKDLPGAEEGEYSVNISELINNPAVWRVVTNGYPYLTPQQMGLENEFDAYAVTKMAIYCVLGQSNLENYSYDENDMIGHRMYDVLKYLVNLGINGGDVPQVGNLEVNKLGELVNSGEFFYQEYKVNSKINIKNYNIQSISNFPDGSYIANTSNNPQNVFNKGENFRILIPQSELKKDINGNIKIKAEVENYPIFYGKAPSGKQDYIITYDTYGEEEINVNLSIKTNTGMLKVLKVDADTKIPINGVKFELINKESNVKYEQMTDENGEIIFNNLYTGRYILKEIETLNEYELNEEVFEINIEYNKISQITVDNELKKGCIKIIKIDGEEEIRIGGVVFELYDSNMNLLEVLETDENGEACSNNYPSFQKKYYLKEVEGKDGYIVNKELMEIDLSNTEIFEIVVKNYKIPKEPEVMEPEPEIFLKPKPELIPIIEIEETEDEIVVEEIKKLPETGK